MTIAELNEIVSTGDINHIEEQLKGQGYYSCSKRKYAEEVNLGKLFLGDLLETEAYADEANGLRYSGGIFYNVQNHENCEIILVCVGDLENIYPLEVNVWAKKIGE
ncbi:MAG: hypothetical protein NC131_04650 [Roseburia sp.]|nr:hypothetical protein [Roseburia sp.]